MTGVIKVKDCDPSVFSDFIYFLYCGDGGRISKENVFSLYTQAEACEVSDLKAECLNFIKNNMAVDNFCEYMTWALDNSETELIASAVTFFVANAGEILMTVDWQTFAAEKPAHSSELFIQYVRSVENSHI